MKNREAPQVLYKYYSEDRTEVFDDFRVRFSQLSALNDPFEFLIDVPPGIIRRGAIRIAKQAANPLAILGMAARQAVEAPRENEKLRSAPWIARAIISVILLVILPIAALLLYPFLRRAMIKIAEGASFELEELILRQSKLGLILVFSCSETWDSVPMWAHYADNHTGFALGFDPILAFRSKRPKSENECIPPRKVIYQDQMPTIKSKSFEVNDFLAAKMSHWSYEREWRFTQVADEADERGRFSEGNEILLFQIEPSSIKEIIFGAKCRKEVIERVVSACEHKGIEPDFFMVRRGDKYGFERVKLSDQVEAEKAPARLVPTLRGHKYEHLEEAFGKVALAAERNWLLRKISRLEGGKS